MRFEDRYNWSFRFLRYVERTVCRWLPDTDFVNHIAAQVHYFADQKTWANWREPKYYSEFLMRHKLAPEARSSLRKRTTCKVNVKSFIEDRLGPDFIVPTIDVLNTAEELDRYHFPERCVAKPAHNCGEFIIFDGRKPTKRERKRMREWFKLDYFYFSREPNYKDLDRRVIIEPFLNVGGHPPADVKIFCFHGEPKIIQLDIARTISHSRAFYDVEGEPIPAEFHLPRHDGAFPYMAQLDELLRACRAVSSDFPALRVDFYVLDNRIYIGELTHFVRNCAGRFQPETLDLYIAKFFEDPTLPFLADDVQRIINGEEPSLRPGRIEEARSAA